MIFIAPNPPIISSVISFNTSVVRVIWTRPDVLNGILSNYTIVYTSNDPQKSVTVEYNNEQVNLYISLNTNIRSLTTDTDL